MSSDRSSPDLIASVYESDVSVARRRLVELPEACALVELRADGWSREAIVETVGGAGRPLIVTVRRTEQGGRHRGPESERRANLLAALEAGAAFIDVEEDGELRELADLPGVAERVILSHHGAPCRLDALLRVHRRMATSAAARLKIVCEAERPGELVAIRDLLRRVAGSGQPVCAFALGRAGRVSRLLAPGWGSWASYAAASAEAPAGAGQWSVAEMLELYDMPGIAPSTRFLALIGADLRRSPSPAMHQAGYRALGLDARYLPLEADSFGELASLLEPGRDRVFDGFGVTIPFKEEVARLCEPGDAVARASGAVNTVRLDDERRIGFNTDGPAVLAAASRFLDPRGARAAVVGAGGTARAAAASLTAGGALVTLFNRGQRRGRAASEAVGCGYRALTDLPGAEWDLLVQATPLGGEGERWLEPAALRGRLVVDAVYRPGGTPLVRDARRGGLHAVDGFELLVLQAVAQFRLLTGRDIDADLFRAATAPWQSAEPT